MRFETFEQNLLVAAIKVEQLWMSDVADYRLYVIDGVTCYPDNTMCFVFMPIATEQSLRASYRLASKEKELFG